MRRHSSPAKRVGLISLHYAGKRVLVIGHQVVVLRLRYLLEGLTEQQILAIDAAADVANGAVTEYVFDADQGPNGNSSCCATISSRP